MTDRRRTLSLNGMEISFVDPIEKTLRCGNVTIVLTDDVDADPDDYTENRNLFAYDAEGKLLWRAEDQRFPGEGNEVNPYVDVKRIDDALIRVWDYYGTIYTMVARTGEIRER